MADQVVLEWLTAQGDHQHQDKASQAVQALDLSQAAAVELEQLERLPCSL
jgi:hypothetical protein